MPPSSKTNGQDAEDSSDSMGSPDDKYFFNSESKKKRRVNIKGIPQVCFIQTLYSHVEIQYKQNNTVLQEEANKRAGEVTFPFRRDLLSFSAICMIWHSYTLLIPP